MKTESKLLLISLSVFLLLYVSFYTIPEATIVLHILILIGIVSTISGSIIYRRNMLERFKSDEKSDKTKEDD